MSVNSGGLFFYNNPTSLPTQPPQDNNNGEQNETQMNATTVNYQQQQQQQQMANSNNNNSNNLQQNLALLQQAQLLQQQQQQQIANLNQQQQAQQGNNVLMSNNEIDVAITSLFQNNPTIMDQLPTDPLLNNHSQAIGSGQLNNNTGGLVQNVQTQGIVQNIQPQQGIVQNNTGLSSFFFNPLAFLTNNITTNTQNQVQQQQAVSQLQQAVQVQAANQLLNNQSNLVGAGVNNNNNNNVMNTNLGISSVNYQQQQQQHQGQNLGNLGNANNILLNNGGVYQQQNGTIQMNNTLQQQQQQQPLPSTSPMPMAFLTPNQGPTPCPTPPPKSPMFHDANEFSLDNNNNNQVQEAPQTLQVTPTPPQDDTSPPPPSFPSKSLFQRGVSSMGSALGAVATYVNQSLLSGIPFHVADRAMKESKETYAKWWEDGINVHSKKKRKKDMEDNNGGEDGDDVDDAVAAGKKRKLDSGRAALGTGCTGSALSNLLKKHYDDMGIDTSSNFVEYEQQLYTQSQQLPLALPTVDSSIINPRRSQFEHKKKELHTSAQATRADSASGYDAFNNIGGMYDFGNGENEADSGIAQGGVGDTYHSLYSYCTTNEVDANDIGTTSLESAAATTAYNAHPIIQQQSTLDGTMEAIQQLLEEKNRASEENELLQMMSAPRDWVKKSIRSELVSTIMRSFLLLFLLFG